MFREFLNSADNWNDLISKFKGLDYYSLYEWGKLKESQGWLVKRFILFEESNIELAFQILIKQKYFFKLIWIPGGILGNLNQNYLSKIISELKIKFGRNIIIRIGFSKYINDDDYKLLKDLKFIKINSVNYANSSMILNLTDKKELSENFSKNWRHNLKRSFKYNNTVLNYNDDMKKSLVRIYKEMEELKNLNNLYNNLSLNFLLKELKDLLIFKVCIDTNNNLLSIRCAIKFKNYAWDLLAATSKEGRKNYSSYQVTYEVLKECVKKNVTYYDLSGINKKLNKGVYNFKKGTGSKEYEKLGLWQYNRYTLLNKFLSNFIN